MSAVSWGFSWESEKGDQLHTEFFHLGTFVSQHSDVAMEEAKMTLACARPGIFSCRDVFIQGTGEASSGILCTSLVTHIQDRGFKVEQVQRRASETTGKGEPITGVDRRRLLLSLGFAGLEGRWDCTLLC